MLQKSSLIAIAIAISSPATRDVDGLKLQRMDATAFRRGVIDGPGGRDRNHALNLIIAERAKMQDVAAPPVAVAAPRPSRSSGSFRAVTSRLGAYSQDLSSSALRSFRSAFSRRSNTAPEYAGNVSSYEEAQIRRAIANSLLEQEAVSELDIEIIRQANASSEGVSSSDSAAPVDFYQNVIEDEKMRRKNEDAAMLEADFALASSLQEKEIEVEELKLRLK